MVTSASSGVLFSSQSASCPVPALFHTFELSSPGLGARSNIVIFNSGFNRFISIAWVELMIYAPIKTTFFLAIYTHTYPVFCDFMYYLYIFSILMISNYILYLRFLTYARFLS